MALTTAQIQQAYVTFFSRPADPAGLGYWSSYSGSIADLYATFAKQTEYSAAFSGLSSAQKVNLVYNNLFGRDAEPAGLLYWAKAVDAGTITIANLALAVSAGSQGADATTVANRVTAATAFTAALDTTAEILGYTGATANAAAKTWLGAVTTAESLTTATAAIDTAAAGVVAVGGAAGSTFTLTTGADAFTGTSGNDTFRANLDATTTANATFQAADEITGGAGVDTLTIRNAGAAADSITPLYLTGVEKVVVTDSEAADKTTVDLSNAVGVTDVINDGSKGAVELNSIGTAALTVKNVATNVTTKFTRDSAAALTINLEKLGTPESETDTLAYAAAITSESTDNKATSVTINATGTVLVDTMTVTGDAGTGGYKAQTVTLNAAGTTTIGEDGDTGIAGFDSTKADKIVVTGAGKVELRTLDVSVAVVDASANTGGVAVKGTVYGGTNATELTTPGLEITGGSGADTISLDGVATAVVKAGAGNDTVTLTNTHAAGASIDGGDGVDTIVLTNDMAGALDEATADGAALRATLTGFETLAISDIYDTKVTLSSAGAGYTGLRLLGDVGDGGNGTSIEVAGVANGATIEFRKAAAANSATFTQEDALLVTMTGAAESSTDSLTLKLNANLKDGDTVTYKVNVPSINTINVIANDRVDDVTDNDEVLITDKDNTPDDGYVLTLGSVANLNNVNISGSSKITYAAASTALVLKSIDASASTGNAVLDESAFDGSERLEIKGSQGVNTITGTDKSFGEKITGGAKGDTIDAGDGADDIYGGGGRDVLNFALTDGSGVTASTIDQIFDFGKTTAAVTGAQNGTDNDTAAEVQAATNVLGGADADFLQLDTPALHAAIAATDMVSALEAVDTTVDEFAGKTITAALSAKGLVTLAGADAAMVDSLGEWVAVARAMNTVDKDVVAFEFSGSTYVLQQDTGNSATDLLIQLVGVTGVTGINVAGGGVAVTAGEIFVVAA